jgi:hypothetical protein
MKQLQSIKLKIREQGKDGSYCFLLSKVTELRNVLSQHKLI